MIQSAGHLERAERLTGASQWIARAVRVAGRELIGEPELIRDRPWSTQLRGATDGGPVWFKAGCPALAFEPALHALLAQLLPDDVDAPLAVDVDRGWLLTADRGPTLSATRAATAADWAELLAKAAAIQSTLAGAQDAVLATGLPDRRPHRLVERHRDTVRRMADLPNGHPSALTAAELDTLASAEPRVESAADQLATCPLPATLQHGDLHANNAFATPNGLRLFDFGDAQWAAAAEVLFIPSAVIHHDEPDGATWRFALAAYRRTWAALGHPLSADDLAALMPAMEVSAAVNRCGTWLDALLEATPGELAEWGEGPRRALTVLLDERGSTNWR